MKQEEEDGVKGSGSPNSQLCRSDVWKTAVHTSEQGRSVFPVYLEDSEKKYQEKNWSECVLGYSVYLDSNKPSDVIRFVSGRILECYRAIIHEGRGKELENGYLVDDKGSSIVDLIKIKEGENRRKEITQYDEYALKAIQALFCLGTEGDQESGYLAFQGGMIKYNQGEYREASDLFYRAYKYLVGIDDGFQGLRAYCYYLDCMVVLGWQTDRKNDEYQRRFFSGIGDLIMSIKTNDNEEYVLKRPDSMKELLCPILQKAMTLGYQMEMLSICASSQQ